MIALVGRAALVAAVFFGAVGAAAGWLGVRPWAWRMAWGFFLSMALATGALEAALLGHDFSVGYVAQVGARDLPAWVTAVSLWSALEGSVLFWGFIFAGYVALFAWLRRNEISSESSTALAVLLAAGAAFGALALGPASPFALVFPSPADGPGPNPLLQNHPLMAIHPPLLYAGYVGTAVPFALAASALREGRLDRSLIASIRGWLMGTWIFLTAGIALGGRWAYDVLGWGGYWSWDPVENASLMPWLMATAALHAVQRAERRDTHPVCTLVLVQSPFLLALLGTFLTRSGIVTSVHAFAPSALGPSLLGLMSMALVFCVVLVAARAGRFERVLSPTCRLDRALGLVANNLVLAAMTSAVLLGTLYPVAVRAFRSASVTVGEGFYDAAAAPLGIVLLFLLGAGPALPWGGIEPRRALRRLAPRATVGLAATVASYLWGARGPWLLGALAVGGFAIAAAIECVVRPFARALWRRDGRAVAAHPVEGRRHLGGHLAHLGIALTLVAVAVSSAGKHAWEATLKPGETAPFGRYLVTFRGAERVLERHRESYIVHFAVERDGAALGELAPRLNRYFSTGEALGSPAVRSSPREDLYLTAVNVDPAKREVGLRAQIAPMVSWIWIGVAVTVLGGLVAAVPGRRRAVAEKATVTRDGLSRLVSGVRA